jgi:hypothetical protein
MFLDIIHRPVFILKTVLFIFQNTKFWKKNKQNGVLDKVNTMDNVQKHNICSSKPPDLVLYCLPSKGNPAPWSQIVNWLANSFVR